MARLNSYTIKKLFVPLFAMIAVVVFTQCVDVKLANQKNSYHRHDEYKPKDESLTSKIGYSAPLPKTGWELVWNDEFETPDLDTTAWNYEVNGDGGGNNELQFYTDFKTNVWQNDGLLYLKAVQENYKGKTYTSGRVNTRYKQDYTYGRFDIRAKVPTQQGIWPAIWMLPTDYEYGSWPRSGEIDIMESIGNHPKTVYGTLHYGPQWPNNKNTGKSIELEKDLADEFHVYSVEWDSLEIKWFLDDVLFSTKTRKDLDPHPWPFDKNFHIILNLAIGGQWPGNPDQSTVFPKYMYVDYVRVYKKEGN
jgi:beta-glucanase (GH16 family)